MTAQELDNILDTYFDGRLEPGGEQQLSEFVIENQDRAYDDLCGTVIAEELIPDYDPGWPVLLTKYLDEARGAELEEGAQPTDEELELFRAAWLHWAAHSGEADADVIPAFFGVRLEHSDGRSCYGVLLVRGYSFTAIEEDFRGLFRDRDEALRHIRSLGHIDADVVEPSPELIERSRSSSRNKPRTPVAPHPLDEMPPEEFENSYLRDFGQWDRLTYGQLERLLRRSLLHYGLANDITLIGAMSTLMRRAVRDLPSDRRSQVYNDVCRTIEDRRLAAFYAFIPVVVHEPEAQIVATAAIDFVSLSPMMDDGRPAGLGECVRLIRDGVPNSPGGVFGGLVSLGDERFRSDLEALKPYLSPRDVQAAARCETGLLSDSQIRFWLDWADEMMPLEGSDDADSMIGSIATALARMRKRVLAPTVIRAERLFPAHHYEVLCKTLESWSLDEYARLIAGRLYALEKGERPPKVFSTVLELWGLRPRATRSKRLSTPLVC